MKWQWSVDKTVNCAFVSNVWIAKLYEKVINLGNELLLANIKEKGNYNLAQVPLNCRALKRQ